MISRSISFSFDHSGCRNNSQVRLTLAACSSAQSKSLLLKTMILSSFAFSNTEGCGALNFFGDKQTQSQFPVRGYAPDVSMLVFNPALCNSDVSKSKLYMAGSPPVTTAISVPDDFAFLTIS